MAEVVICDTKGCGAIIEGEQVRDYERKDDASGWIIRIGVDVNKDRCPECTRKLFAKAAYSAWSELKQVRKGKEIKEVDSGS